jgi:hypothetical protein
MISIPKRIVLKDDYADFDEDDMEFRLTYEGPLLATQRDPVNGQPDRRAEHKHEIRKAFHSQLKRLWEITPFLKTGEASGPTVLVTQSSPDAADYKIDTLAKRYAMFGFNFVPLVTANLDLLCSLDILFLRKGPPGSAIESGDIDNRLKTLFDALRIPTPGERYSARQPEADEKPFFCLLEDDKLITKISVETDRLLQDIGPKPDHNDVRLVISVRLRPQEMTIDNMQFG